jgi:hypothetical protein
MAVGGDGNRIDIEGQVLEAFRFLSSCNIHKANCLTIGRNQHVAGIGGNRDRRNLIQIICQVFLIRSRLFFTEIAEFGAGFKIPQARNLGLGSQDETIIGGYSDCIDVGTAIEAAYFKAGVGIPQARRLIVTASQHESAIVGECD